MRDSAPGRPSSTPTYCRFRLFHFPVRRCVHVSHRSLTQPPSLSQFLSYPLYSYSLQRSSFNRSVTMAPITEEVVTGLKDTIGKLENRIEDLEGRLGFETKPKSVAEQMRIILMGPPGAGMLNEIEFFFVEFVFFFFFFFFFRCPSSDQYVNRQGNPGTASEGEVLCLPLGECLVYSIRPKSGPLIRMDDRLPVTCCDPRSRRRPS